MLLEVFVVHYEEKIKQSLMQALDVESPCECGLGLEAHTSGWL